MKLCFKMSDRFGRAVVIYMMVCMVQLLCAGCTIKEDRSVCPCRMCLDFSALDASEHDGVTVRVSTPDALVLLEKVRSEDFTESFVRDVPRGNLTVSVWSGAEADNDGRNLLDIPYGLECPPLYMDTFSVNATGERCSAKVLLHKNHCRLSVRMKGNETVPYSLTFRGAVSGYGFDGTLAEGDFCSVAYPEEDGALRTVLPRQADSSLMMDLDDGMGFFKTFAIGEYMAAGGYDWNAENLADVEVVLDFYVTHIHIFIQGWDAEYDYTVIL